MKRAQSERLKIKCVPKFIFMFNLLPPESRQTGSLVFQEYQTISCELVVIEKAIDKLSQLTEESGMIVHDGRLFRSV